MKRNKFLGNTLLLIASVIWGTAFVFQRNGMDSIGPIAFNAARTTLSALVVAPIALCCYKKSAPVSTEKRQEYLRHTIVGGICCGIFLALASAMQQTGLVYTDAGKGGFISSMYMLPVPFLNLLLFRKRIQWTVWISLVMAVVGLYLLCLTGGFRLERGDSFMCLAALAFSFQIMCCDYFASKGDPVSIAAIQFATVAVVSWPTSFLIETPTVKGLLGAGIPLLYCGLMSGGVGYTFQLVAQKHTDPTPASLLMSLESVFAVIAGAILLGEQMLPRERIGCGILFLAVILVQIPLPEKRKKRTTQANLW